MAVRGSAHLLAARRLLLAAASPCPPLPSAAGQFNTVSDRLRRFIAVSSTLHEARSYKHQGRDLAAQQQAGEEGQEVRPL